MPRTTLDIDGSVLRELKRRRQREGKSLGQIASALLASALREQRAEPVPPLEWNTQPMRARIDLEDKEALHAALDER